MGDIRPLPMNPPLNDVSELDNKGHLVLGLQLSLFPASSNLFTQLLVDLKSQKPG